MNIHLRKFSHINDYLCTRILGHHSPPSATLHAVLPLFKEITKPLSCRLGAFFLYCFVVGSIPPDREVWINDGGTFDGKESK